MKTIAVPQNPGLFDNLYHHYKQLPISHPKKGSYKEKPRKKRSAIKP